MLDFSIAGFLFFVVTRLYWYLSGLGLSDYRIIGLSEDWYWSVLLAQVIFWYSISVGYGYMMSKIKSEWLWMDLIRTDMRNDDFNALIPC